MPESGASQPERNDLASTYRYLRAAIPVLVLGLLVSVVYQIAHGSDCFLGSISAYYYTPSRPVFVASLAAIGTCLVVNHGSSAWEDHALDLSGYLAFFVAFVPTPLQPSTLPESATSCARSNLPGQGVIAASVDNNVFALLVCGAVVLALMWRAWARHGRPASGRLGTPSVLVGSVALAAVWVVFLASPSTIQRVAHLVSAVALFIGFSEVVALNAVRPLARWASAPVPATRFRRVYLGVLVAMGTTAVVTGALYLLTDLDHVVFWLEALLIGEFAVFWVTQTVELQDGRDRATVAATASARRNA